MTHPVPPLYLCLDNLRSVHNVGSIFRSSDAAGVKGIYLCGITPTPVHPKMAKTALGSQHTVPWEHHCDTLKCLSLMKKPHCQLVAMETGSQSRSLFTFGFSSPTCLIFGTEITGLDQAILQLADAVVSIPQYGLKESLNVASSAAIAIYEFRRQNPIDPGVKNL